MPLPLCVKVDFRDRQSQQNLLDEGWRGIGELMTWRGRVKHIEDGHVKEVTGSDVIGLAKQIAWSGRLWSDKKIPEKVAWAETEKFLLETSDNIHMIGNVGFIVSTQTKIKLIGVHPMVRGAGLAAVMIRATRPEHGEWLEAGTYLHNEAAQRLYSGLGMRHEKRQAVFHK